MKVFWKSQKVMILIGSQESNYYLDPKILDNEDRALKNQMVNGHILPMMQHIIR